MHRRSRICLLETPVGEKPGPKDCGPPSEEVSLVRAAHPNDLTIETRHAVLGHDSDEDGAPAQWPALPDEALLGCVADSQSNALWEVYQRYSRATHLLACSVSGDPAVADDVVVGVFIDLWFSPHAFASESRRDSEHALPSRLLDASYRRSLETHSAVVGPSPSVGTVAMAPRHALAQMSRAEREVFVLILADFTRDEVAAALALSTRVVLALLHRALVHARYARYEPREGR